MQTSRLLNVFGFVLLAGALTLATNAIGGGGTCSDCSTAPAATDAVPATPGSVRVFAQKEASVQSKSSSNALAEELNFTLEDQNGKTHTLADYADKTVVLEWTNPECPVVVKHYQNDAMAKLAQSYMDKGIVWLAINTTHSATHKTNQDWANLHHITYPILNDSQGVVGKKYHAKTTPHMYIIHKGKIVYQGAIDNEMTKADPKDPTVNFVAQTLEEIQAEKPVSVASTKPYGCSVKYKR